MVAPKSITDSSKLLSVSAVAREMGVHRSTVHVWIRDGIMQTQRHGVHHAIQRREVDRVKKLLGLDSKKEGDM
jgi:excisionase family DNA binding protein